MVPDKENKILLGSMAVEKEADIIRYRTVQLLDISKQFGKFSWVTCNKLYWTRRRHWHFGPKYLYDCRNVFGLLIVMGAVIASVIIVGRLYLA